MLVGPLIRIYRRGGTDFDAEREVMPTEGMLTEGSDCSYLTTTPYELPYGYKHSVGTSYSRIPRPGEHPLATI